MSASEICNESDTTDMIINTQAFSDFEGTQHTVLSAEEEDKSIDFTSVQENMNIIPFDNFVIGQNVNTDFEHPVDPTSETILKNGEGITKFFLFPP